jgi:hypothetical protein
MVAVGKNQRVLAEALVWTTYLIDRTPPAMIRGLLEELPRLQRLLSD